jgi:tetratricopeptide (TPR) repeat protein
MRGGRVFKSCGRETMRRRSGFSAGLQSGIRKIGEALFHRGIAYLESGRLDEAIWDFTESLRRKEEVEAYYNRGMAWLEKRDVERALADAEVWTCGRL